jgi:myo-inositol-1(or 4)-monophosphatase
MLGTCRRWGKIDRPLGLGWRRLHASGIIPSLIHSNPNEGAMTPQLDQICRLLRTTAAAEILPRFRHVASREKADGSLVTEADLATQAAIAAELAVATPQIPVLGEEMDTAEQARRLGQANTGVWCLDPVDGTSNFAGGFPLFAVSLALIQGGDVVRGAIYDPIRDECFCAERGGGAFLNGVSLRLGLAPSDLGDCLAAVDLKRLTPAELVRLGTAAPYRSQRSLGCVALEWCWLAAGRFQLYLHGGQRLWDYAAGRLIASEAGVASKLFEPGAGPMLTLAQGLSLAPRRAVAAPNAALLDRWQGWIQEAGWSGSGCGGSDEAW